MLPVSGQAQSGDVRPDLNAIPVQLKLGTSPIAITPAPLRIGEECWVPAQTVYKLGWKSITPPAGSAPARLTVGTRAFDVEFKTFNNTNYFELTRIVEAMDGLMEWDASRKSLTIRAKLNGVTLSKTGISVFASFPIRWKAFMLESPRRIAIDLNGAYLPATPPTVAASNEVKVVRYGEPEEGIVRVVCEMNGALKLLPSKIDIASYGSFSWKLDPNAPKPVVPARLGRLAWDLSSRSKMVLRIPTDRRAQALVRNGKDPLVVTIDVPNSQYTEKEPLEKEIDEHEVVKEVRFEPGMGVTKSGARLSIDLKRVAGVNVMARTNELAIVITKPRGADGTLKGKIIVVDPGHGGSDDGCNTRSYISRAGAYITEQSVTLAIGTLLAQKLTDLGATVIMTRSQKETVGLHDRPKMANAANADFFISVHVNSNGKVNSRSGADVYYHHGSVDSAAFGNAIQAEIGKVSGLPCYGIVHDKTLYQSGLAVLRLSTMPAVLIETGYMNHDKDRAKLIDPDWQEAMAEAIALGVKNYVGDTDDEKDSKQVNKNSTKKKASERENG